MLHRLNESLIHTIYSVNIFPWTLFFFQSRMILQTIIIHTFSRNKQTTHNQQKNSEVCFVNLMLLLFSLPFIMICNKQAVTEKALLLYINIFSLILLYINIFSLKHWEKKWNKIHVYSSILEISILIYSYSSSLWTELRCGKQLGFSPNLISISSICYMWSVFSLPFSNCCSLK